MLELRSLHPEELPDASALCLRSKAHWGYDEAFMRACVDELTLTHEDLQNDSVVAAFSDGQLAGVAQVSNDADGCFLEKLFVEPGYMGAGIGRALFEWSCKEARRLGASNMIVEADPDAAPFYRKMGCEDTGFAMSGSIAGRKLPRLVMRL